MSLMPSSVFKFLIVFDVNSRLSAYPEQANKIHNTHIESLVLSSIAILEKI